MTNTAYSNIKRITELIEYRLMGKEVLCRADFEVNPVSLMHQENPYQAYIFIANFSGTINGEPFKFRKCYAKGCPHNLCTHVSQAVMIANRYLQRDYYRLANVGIQTGNRLFTLDDMVVKFEDMKDSGDPNLTIEDYLVMAKEGQKVTVDVTVEFVPAVEHFAGYKESQIFLFGDFDFTASGKTQTLQRCFACFPQHREAEEKVDRVLLANKRLVELYQFFDTSGIQYEKRFFQA
jgi:hypothetical protein